jgi:2-dehydro-3-deoxyphosphooctonate aldolase (KDO 8-P synthase)
MNSICHEINIGKLSISNNLPLVLIAGPCMMESRNQAIEIAHSLSEITKRIKIPFIYKASFDKANRTGSSSNRGVGLEKSLEVFEEIKDKYDCKIITDVHEPFQCAIVAQTADILQIPALLCKQTDLILSATKTNKPINIKKGQFLSPYEMQNVALKACCTGNNKIMLCDRGTFFGYGNLINDMRALPIMASTGFPVIFDATHSVQKPGALGDKSGGERCFVETLSRAAIATGIAGLFIETHYDPDNALSDGPNMVPLNFLEEMLKSLMKIDKISKNLSYQNFSYQKL